MKRYVALERASFKIHSGCRPSIITAETALRAPSLPVDNRAFATCARFSSSAQRSRSSMIETNIRIVEPGVNLRLHARCAEVVTQDLSHDLLQRACGNLQKRYGLAAVVAPDKSSVLVATSGPVPKMVVQADDWRLEVKDTGTTRELCFAELDEAQLFAQLLERCLLAQL